MNFKQYIYEFIGFLIFYGFAGLIFNFDSTVICFIAGIIGVLIGKFLSKVNGFFFEKIVDYNITPLEKNPDEFNVIFTILAKYKTNPISIWAGYTTKNVIDVDTLSSLLYNKINQSHYNKILKEGFVSVSIKLKEGQIELVLMEN
jgi:hypothetical protein